MSTDHIRRLTTRRIAETFDACRRAGTSCAADASVRILGRLRRFHGTPFPQPGAALNQLRTLYARDA